jgi:hypothetical protein
VALAVSIKDFKRGELATVSTVLATVTGLREQCHPLTTVPDSDK